jgi:hypothetical protein
MTCLILVFLEPGCILGNGSQEGFSQCLTFVTPLECARSFEKEESMKDKAVLVVLVFKPEEKAGEPKINAKGSSESYRTNYDRIFSKAN